MECIQISMLDNVAVVLKNMKSSQIVKCNDKKISLKDNIPYGHKFALKTIEKGNILVKYGSPIGHAKKNIYPGEHVHVHNVATNLQTFDKYSYEPTLKEKLFSNFSDKDVKIYRRKNGEISIRNELWILPTVGCVNGIGKQIKKQFLKEIKGKKYIDGVFLYDHTYGCSQLGKDHINTRTILQDMASHPNAGAVLIIGLGCENNQIEIFRDTLKKFDTERIRFLKCQEHTNEVDIGVRYLHELYNTMKHDRRKLGKISEVKFGLKCGGSDGFSGITANPMLGKFSDYLISNNGTVTLTEVPEMFGAEQILMNRCKNKQIFQKLVDMINNFKNFFKSHGQPIYENPSPGNKAGGITTLEEKSLGCTQKSGTSQIIDVLSYGEKIRKKGLNLLYAPGNDAVSTSALASSGSHIILFTTGLGTPYGSFVPTLKIATNTAVAEKKKHWIDFDAGEIIKSGITDNMIRYFIDVVIEVINGKKTCNEMNDFRELGIFKMGVTL